MIIYVSVFLSVVATTLIDFGRPPQWNCPIPESDAAIADTETSERYNEPVYTTSEQYQVHTETSVRTRVSRCRYFYVLKYE